MNKQNILLLIFFILLNSCTVMYRAVRYGSEDIDDYKTFPTYDLTPNEVKHHFKIKENSFLDTFDIHWNYENVLYHNLNSLLEKTSTISFLVIQNDSIIYENYFNNNTRSGISTVFSVSKSVTSLLTGIAMDEGYITDVNDPVTKYITELNSADPLFKKLTIKDLLDMRSGIKFNENYSFNPFSKIAHLYYGTNQLGLIKRLHFECEPGTKHEYQSISTALLGLVIEKATGQSFAKYFEDKVWNPLEMENTAKWSLDDRKHQSAKAYGGLSITAVDLAKNGQLYLNGGKYKGQQIVSKKWIKETLTPNIHNDGYQNQWYSYGGIAADSTGNKEFNDSITAQRVWQERYSKRYPYYNIVSIKKSDLSKKNQKKYWKYDGDEYWRLMVYADLYYAQGLFSQIMFIDPKKKTIFIRFGYNRLDYFALINKINSEI